MITETMLQNVFLDYFNDYITLEAFAFDYGIPREEAELLIKLGRLTHERIVKEHRDGTNE